RYGGASSNALAIKILERLVSYYYVGDWNNDDPMASVIAHDIPDRIANVSSTAFVGKFFGIQANDIPGSQIKDMIKLKLMNPEEPVYISMSYGKADIFGKFHGRHALRIDKVIPKGSGNYDIVLINPHDNTKRETYSLDDIEKRNCRFCLFNTNPHRAGLTRKLLELPENLGKYVFASPSLQEMLMFLEEKNLLIDNKTIPSCIILYQEIPYFEKLFKLCAGEKATAANCLKNANGSKKDFLKLLLANVSRMDLLEMVLREEASQELLGEVLAELASKNLGQENNAGINFGSKAFFEFVVSSAITQKKTQLGGSFENAKKMIEDGLIHFYFVGGINNLTRNSGLRALFTAGVFTGQSIETLFTPKILLAKAVAKYLAAYDSSPEVERYIQGKDTSQVDEGFLNALLASTNFKNSDEVFRSLHRLSQLNPVMAKALFVLASQKIHSLFGQSFEEYAQTVDFRASSEFKSWFESLYKPKQTVKIPIIDNIMTESLEQARKAVLDSIQQINSIKIDFSHLTLAEYVDVHTNSLKKQLEKISNSLELQQAANLLGFMNGQHPEVHKALQNQWCQIDLAATLQLDLIKEHERGIDEYIRQIKEFPIVFYNKSTREAIKRQEIRLSQRVFEIIQNKDFFGQQLIENPKIKNAYHDKIKEINDRSEGVQKEMTERSRELIRTVAEQINQFFVNFSDKNSSFSLIEFQRENLLRQLDKLVKENQELVKAQFFLGLPEIPEAIKKALQTKKQEINEVAQQLIIEINQKKAAIKIQDGNAKIIAEGIEKINSFKFNFDNLRTVVLVQLHADELKKELAKISDSSELLQAEKELGFTKERHPEVQNALQNQLQMIDIVAKQQLEFIQDYEREIEDCAEKIKELPVRFYDTSTIEAIEEQRINLNQQVKKITDLEDFWGQQLIIIPKIKKASEDKIDQINTHAQKLQMTIVERARETIDLIKKQIDSFHIGFGDQSSYSAIELQKNNLLRQLDELVKENQELLKVQSILHLPEIPEEIVKALEARKQKVNELAGQLIIAINKRNAAAISNEKEIEKYVRRIEEFPIKFDDTSTIEIIEKQRIHLNEQLKAITELDDLLGQPLITNQKIRKVFQEKIQKINIEAETLQKNIIERARKVMSEVSEQIQKFPVTFDGCNTPKAVEAQKQLLIVQVQHLIDNKPDLEEAQKQFGYFNNNHLVIEKALTDKISEIRINADEIINKIQAKEESRKIIEEIEFIKHLEIIESMFGKLVKKAKDNKDYRNAAQAAAVLYHDLVSAKDAFLDSQLPTKIRCEAFHASCSKAINKALPVLEKHRGWKQVLADIAGALLSIMTFGGANLLAGRWRLFPTQTESEKTVKEFSETLQTLQVKS
ncbi:hypothetical protein EP47_07825, partial [Legionella norrlandica]